MNYHAVGASGPKDLSLEGVGYAGWNTDGNTLGTVISNIILLNVFPNANPTGNSQFNTLRILEDCYYQALVRSELIDYVMNVTGDDINNLATDLQFYEHFTWKLLNSDYEMINQLYSTEFVLDSVYYPW